VDYRFTILIKLCNKKIFIKYFTVIIKIVDNKKLQRNSSLTTQSTYIEYQKNANNYEVLLHNLRT
jgi:hypothetical protein